MKRKNCHPRVSTAFAGRSRPLPIALALLFLLTWQSSLVMAQSDADADGDSQETSGHVEESEEAFRRRMELEEAGDQADVIPDRTTGSVKAPEGIDALPYDSRKHLRDEMRNVIIEQGEWQPEDVNATYPYTPSAAAQGDPQLRQQEEKAWGELVQEYHKREAAALAGGGRSNGSAGQSGGEPGKPGSGATASQAGRKSAGTAEPRPEAEAASSTAAGAGVSQSALDFLRGQSSGQSSGQGSVQSSGEGSGQASEASGQPSGQSQDMAQNDSTETTAAAASSTSSGQQAQAESEANAEPSSSSSEEKTDDPEPPPPPGSVAIAELLALENTRKNEVAEATENSGQSNPPAAPANESAAEAENPRTTITESPEAESPPPRPGTIAIPELKRLQGVDSDDEAGE
jgi:hypothetical protein